MKSNDLIIGLLAAVALFVAYEVMANKINPGKALGTVGKNLQKMASDTGKNLQNFAKETQAAAQNIADNAQDITTKELGSIQTNAVSLWDVIQGFFSTLQQSITLAFNGGGKSNTVAEPSNAALFGNVQTSAVT